MLQLLALPIETMDRTALQRAALVDHRQELSDGPDQNMNTTPSSSARRSAGAHERLRTLPDASGSSCASWSASDWASCCPGPVQAIGRMEVAQVNLPVGLLIWVMIIPMLLKVDFGALGGR
jgi:hypothetical protein